MKHSLSSKLGLVLVLFLSWAAFAQLPAQSSARQTTIRVQTSLVLVDVISRDPKRGLPVRGFKREDFRLFNDRKEVPLTAFDVGYDTRPVVLWLVVICNEAEKSAVQQSLLETKRCFALRSIS
jgi:hypothetical protein